MPQLSPLKWLILYISTITITTLIIIKMNYFFSNKINFSKTSPFLSYKQMKWKTLI
ncbi:ATP synthase F0 subunit 8 (mitochondrion) [Vespa mandarinia]|uniref:ATP synthase FO subunit 8 n=1 Tax=Vespa mandarinia TaxID=7446 RepID=A0A0F7H1L8_VESMA|nr:ATP synthase F0 subunit 8 [Vespa mandarinia]AKG64610.1 ATP synthase FO subunit 8 [Vespa mandarinia]WHL55417.1 ATP synthase F0 subunit 8 [Vespa mandarinia]WHL55443.1 ATP synthase F0 subunit 8 [Vespa mandarinia]BCD56246.1 ATP synthase FO subunit 8 [Vespa mandarinia]BCD56259.1 ATP synthase FO subunit 8 [Vespa mandarinia]